MLNAAKTYQDGIVKLRELCNGKVECQELLTELTEAANLAVSEGRSIEGQLEESQFYQYEKAEVILLLKVLLEQTEALRSAQRNLIQGERGDSKPRKEQAALSVATESRKLDAAIRFVRNRMPR